VGPERLLSSIVAFDLEKHKVGWHSIQAVQRLFNWATDAELLPRSPFRKVVLPDGGQRKRVLARAELVRLLRAARPAFRCFLLAMKHSLARPQEVRVLRWPHLLPDWSAFVLTEFKGRRRRRDKDSVRTICIDARLKRLLQRLQQLIQPGPEDFVFLNSRGQPWSANAIRCYMRRLRARCGLVAGDGQEQVVAYTLRHTAATQATANGVRDRLLADLMGHTNTRTTARYQHLQAEHLADGIARATRRRSA
jgi:integrase